MLFLILLAIPIAASQPSKELEHMCIYKFGGRIVRPADFEYDSMFDAKTICVSDTSGCSSIREGINDHADEYTVHYSDVNALLSSQKAQLINVTTDDKRCIVVHRPKVLTLSSNVYPYDFLGTTGLDYNAIELHGGDIPTAYRNVENLVPLYEYFSFNRSAYYVDSIPTQDESDVFIRFLGYIVSPFKLEEFKQDCPYLEPLFVRVGVNGQNYYGTAKKALEPLLIKKHLPNGTLGYISDVYAYCESNLVLSQYRKLTYSSAQSITTGDDRLDRCDNVEHYMGYGFASPKFWDIKYTLTGDLNYQSLTFEQIRRLLVPIYDNDQNAVESCTRRGNILSKEDGEVLSTICPSLIPLHYGYDASTHVYTYRTEPGTLIDSEIIGYCARVFDDCFATAALNVKNRGTVSESFGIGRSAKDPVLCYVW
uniref:Uncharacterized protein n=1 Tax=Bursaphelenchus xylophilus TaxID=6326 RepID=A0A1I7SEX0_BURXY